MIYGTNFIYLQNKEKNSYFIKDFIKDVLCCARSLQNLFEKLNKILKTYTVKSRFEITYFKHNLKLKVFNSN